MKSINRAVIACPEGGSLYWSRNDVSGKSFGKGATSAETKNGIKPLRREDSRGKSGGSTGEAWYTRKQPVSIRHDKELFVAKR